MFTPTCGEVWLALGDGGERVVWHPAGCSVIVLPDNISLSGYGAISTGHGPMSIKTICNCDVKISYYIIITIKK